MDFDDDDPLCKMYDEKDLIKAQPKRSTSRTWAVHMSHQNAGARRGEIEGFICCGWVLAGDLTKFDTQELMVAALSKHYPNEKPGRISHWAGDALRFAFDMKPNHLFAYLIEDNGEVMIGTVQGEYEFWGQDQELVDADSASVHRVKWLLNVPRSEFTDGAIRSMNSQHTVHAADQHRAEIEGVLKKHGVVFPQVN